MPPLGAEETEFREYLYNQKIQLKAHIIDTVKEMETRQDWFEGGFNEGIFCSAAVLTAFVRSLRQYAKLDQQLNATWRDRRAFQDAEAWKNDYKDMGVKDMVKAVEDIYGRRYDEWPSLVESVRNMALTQEDNPMA